MLHTDAKSLKSRGDALFAAKRPLDLRNQDIAEHFYPERADFTVTRELGDDFAGHLMSSYPTMVRRDLGNSIGAMLRPKGQQWFETRADREERETHEAKIWLEFATGVQRRAMYDPKAMLSRAAKETDHDFSTFGGGAMSIDVNLRDMTLIYRNWHLRDMAWEEDSYGQICSVHRNWKPTIAELCYAFKGKVHPKIEERKAKEPGEKVLVRHVVIRSDMYAGEKSFTQPWVSMYIDCENEHILEEVGSWTRRYVIPRWATVSGSQYAYSPATVCALPDARLIQAMTLTLLEAGELSVRPPMIGVAEAIRGDLNIYSGGFTSIDAEYDERLGEVLRPLTQDKTGLSFGLEMNDRVAMQIKEAFYLNKLSLPPQGGPDMTAYEVGQRVQEYIRQAMPLFEPIEEDYNSALCDMTFETLMRWGAFGPPGSIPEELRATDVKFTFESPLSEASERQKGQKFMETKALIAEATGIDPTSPMIMDFSVALRDVLGGIRTPEEWLRSEDDVKALVAKEKEAQEAAQLLAGMQQGADVAATLGTASQSFAP
jgi:hypothetical protein